MRGNCFLEIYCMRYFTIRFLLLATIILQTKAIDAQTWARVKRVPAAGVASIAVKNDTVYAGTADRVYIGTNNSDEWKASAQVANANFISAITVLHNNLYAGTYGKGVFVSSNKGDTWVPVNNGLFLTYISKFLIWNDELYAATSGGGFFKYNEVTNSWSTFNIDFYTNVDGNVNDLILFNNTPVAAAGANGNFYKYDTSANKWVASYYLSFLRPGLFVNTLLTDGQSLFAGINGAGSDALLRSDDGGNLWSTDTVGLGAFFTRHVPSSSVDVLASGAGKNYAIVNSLNGFGNNSGNIFIRNKGVAAGSTWRLFAAFDENEFIHAVAENGNRLYACLDGGLYYSELSVLPVVLLNLRAAENDKGVLLQWQTASEHNSDYFNIQRSTDGANFVTIGTNPAAGNSNTILSYSYLDAQKENISAQKIYYRLEEVDKDMRASYSNTINFNYNNNTAVFQLLSNPVRSFITLQASQDIEQATISISGINGKTLYKAARAIGASSQLQINVSSYAAGLYILTVRAGANTTTFKIIKQ